VSCALIDTKVDLETFVTQAPRLNPNARLIKGVVCGIRLEDIADPRIQQIRYLDTLWQSKTSDQAKRFAYEVESLFRCFAPVAAVGTTRGSEAFEVMRFRVDELREEAFDHSSMMRLHDRVEVEAKRECRVVVELDVAQPFVIPVTVVVVGEVVGQDGPDVLEIADSLVGIVEPRAHLEHRSGVRTSLM